jgi:folate-binding Fe-S cluster repair protein YgfZ
MDMRGYEELRETAAWIDLSERGKIRVTGEDRARLLHAMSTNNVKDLAVGEGLYSFFLNDKGRILADAYIYNLGDSFLLDTEPETAQSLLAHLDRYIIADDAVVEDETALWAAVGLEGPDSVQSASRLGIATPDKRFDLSKWGDGFVVRNASTGPVGIRIFTPAPGKQLIAQLTAAGIPEADAEAGRTVRLENCKPCIPTRAAIWDRRSWSGCALAGKSTACSRS